MASSLTTTMMLPLPNAKAPSHAPYTFSFPNCPYLSHSTSFKSFSFALCFNKTTRHFCSLHRRLASPVPALDSDVPHPLHQGSVNLKSSKSFEEWDSWSAKFAGASNIPFLLLQMPQIILNAQNLLAGNKTALLAVPWLGMFTGLLGNLTLLSYFAKKRETEAIMVQTLGVISLYTVFAQLAMAEAMPFSYFLITTVVVAAGVVINFLNYFGKLHAGIWGFWEDFITVGGLSALPQVMWSTFVPYIPNSALPGAIAFVIAVATVIMVGYWYFILLYVTIPIQSDFRCNC